MNLEMGACRGLQMGGTYHGVLHEVAQRRLGGQEQGSSQHVHIIARLRQQVDKALQARPIVPVAAKPLCLSDADWSCLEGGNWLQLPLTL